MKTRRFATVEVDRNKCLSNGYCLDIAAQVFSWDEESISIAGDILLADDDTLLRAARTCPSLAIIVKDEDGKQIYPEE